MPWGLGSRRLDSKFDHHCCERPCNFSETAGTKSPHITTSAISDAKATRRFNRRFSSCHSTTHHERAFTHEGCASDPECERR